MALSNFLPVPNAPLIADDPARDAIWRRWLDEFSNRVVSTGTHNNLSGLQGGTTNEYYHLTASQHSTVTSFGTFTNNRVLITSPTSTITTSSDLTYNSETSTITAPNETINGPTLVINASTWTYGNIYTATQSSGTVPAGTTIQGTIAKSFTADAGGTSVVVGEFLNLVMSGANAATNTQAIQYRFTHAGTGLLTQANAFVGNLQVTSTGSITTARGFLSSANLTSSGAITNFDRFIADAPVMSATGTIGTQRGFVANNLGHATLVTNAVGYDAANMTIAATATINYRAQQNSGTGAWGFLHTGTANNAFNGNVRIGSTVAPTVALDVTGNIAGSGGIALATATKVSSYTATISDFTILANASGTAFTVTLPHASSLPNKIYAIKKTDSSGNAVTVSSVSNIDGATTSTLAAQFNRIMLQSNSTQWWEI